MFSSFGDQVLPQQMRREREPLPALTEISGKTLAFRKNVMKKKRAGARLGKI